jgi:hypothetical protein
MKERKERIERNNGEQLNKKKKVQRSKEFPKVVFSHDMIYIVHFVRV